MIGSDVRRPDLTEELGDRRQHEHLQARVEQRRGEHAQLLAGDRRDGDQHRAGAVAGGDVERVGAGAAHAQPVELHAGQPGIVVDQGDRPVRAARAAQQRARDLVARIAGAEHDDRLGLVVGRAKVAVFDEPGDVAADHRQHQREERRQHGHRPRDQRAAEEIGRGGT